MEWITNFWVTFGDWVAGVLAGWGLPPSGVDLVADIVGVIILLLLGVTAVIVFTPMERKVIARMQDRPGPNRVPLYGTIIAFADAIKMLTKEDIVPTRADKLLHVLGPILVVIPAVLVFAVLPFGPRLVGQQLNVGILYVVAIAGMHVIAIVVAAWGSNNKFALISGFRVVNQLLAYEVPLILSILAVVLLTGTMNLVEIVERQVVPFAVVMPVAALVYTIGGLAEANRSPVDLIEADSEMVAGYLVEYSGMKFAMFFIAEYVTMFAVGIVASTLFLGGWKFFGLEDLLPVLRPVIVFAKAAFIIFLMLWFRATFPRLRFDQLIEFAWKFLVPISLVNLLVVAVVVKIPLADPVTEPYIRAAILFVLNVVMIAVAFLMVRRAAITSPRAPALKRIAAVEK
ncbi:MAG TPA: NADH-quinone oxidoreductase subunit NuoH [Anaerolineae bacterium]|jgi:NADH-quinone oxidoreductase subunit H|nr:NADH-quinone oxidoreductase subunit NuoH [Anaerolineae bacterium]